MRALDMLEQVFPEMPAEMRLCLVATYIDNQQSPEAFEDFLQEARKQPMEDVRKASKPEMIPVAFTEPEIKFLLFALGYTHASKDTEATPPAGRAFLEKMHWATFIKLLDANAKT